LIKIRAIRLADEIFRWMKEVEKEERRRRPGGGDPGDRPLSRREGVKKALPHKGALRKQE
jgi:hypothetical protein